MDLTWQPPPFDGYRPVIQYTLYRNDLDRSNEYILAETGLESNSTSFNVTTDILPYTKYEWRVRACNVIGCSVFEDGVASVPVRTLPDCKYLLSTF